MKIQVMGYRGLLGRAVMGADTRHEVVGSDVDITRCTSADIDADVVINCAGLVKQRNKSGLDFLRVNGLGPQVLSWSCRQAKARLVHVSTDCVFDGHTRGPHDEETPPKPRGIYSFSKMVGEVMTGNTLTVRCSFIGRGGGLIEQMERQQVVKASDNLLWSGNTVSTVAGLLLLLAVRRDITGLLHVPGEFTTRWRLVNHIKSRLGLSTLIVRDDDFSRDRRLVSQRWGDLDLPFVPPLEEQVL